MGAIAEYFRGSFYAQRANSSLLGRERYGHDQDVSWGLFVIVGGVYVTAQSGPALLRGNYQFQDAIKERSRTRTPTPRRARTISAAAIFPQGTRPGHSDQGKRAIQGNASGERSFNGIITIHAPYVVHIDLAGLFRLDLHFDASTENKGVF